MQVCAHLHAPVILKSVRRTRVHDQYFGTMPNIPPDISRAWHCVVWIESVTGSMKLKVRQRRVDITSDCATRGFLHFIRAPHLVTELAVVLTRVWVSFLDTMNFLGVNSSFLDTMKY